MGSARHTCVASAATLAALPPAVTMRAMKSRLAALLLPLTLVACPSKDDGKGDGTDSGTGTSTGASSSGGEELPAPDEVCPAVCDKYKSCADEPAMFDVADCLESCEAAIAFLDMNNPGSGCGDAYIAVNECLSESTCEQIDAYYGSGDSMRPCMEWDDTLGNCAIE